MAKIPKEIQLTTFRMKFWELPLFTLLSDVLKLSSLLLLEISSKPAPKMTSL